MQSKTKGIWIWVRDHPHHSDRYLVLLDTEGLGDVEKVSLSTSAIIVCNIPDQIPKLERVISYLIRAVSSDNIRFQLKMQNNLCNSNLFIYLFIKTICVCKAQLMQKAHQRRITEISS